MVFGTLRSKLRGRWCVLGPRKNTSPMRCRHRSLGLEHLGRERKRCSGGDGHLLAALRQSMNDRRDPLEGGRRFHQVQDRNCQPRAQEMYMRRGCRSPSSAKSPMVWGHLDQSRKQRSFPSDRGSRSTLSVARCCRLLLCAVLAWGGHCLDLATPR